jgi:hypothetical protein
MSARRNVGRRNRDLTNERVDIVFFAHLKARQERPPKEAERDESHDRKQRPLNPGGGDQTSERNGTHDNRGYAEENDEESTWCRQLDRS